MKTNSVSIVIPVYNEAANLEACLEAIEAQTVKPLEVIVVDNNSTDDTVRIAKKFKFVKVVNEKRQGVVHARNTGFDLAQAEIVGRIDGDTLVENYWVEKLIDIFKDQTVGAATGSVIYYDVIKTDLSYKLDLFIRTDLANRMRDQVVPLGANMAIRNSVWQRVKSSTCAKAGLHEDCDLGFHITDLGERIIFDKDLRVGLSLRRYEVGIIEFWKYIKLTPLTYTSHQTKGRRYEPRFYPMLLSIMGSYWFILFCHLIYDPVNKRASLKIFLNRTLSPRVNPATFVD